MFNWNAQMRGAGFNLPHPQMMPFPSGQAPFHPTMAFQGHPHQPNWQQQQQHNFQCMPGMGMMMAQPWAGQPSAVFTGFPADPMGLSVPGLMGQMNPVPPSQPPPEEKPPLPAEPPPPLPVSPKPPSTPQEQGKPPLPGQAKGKWDQTPQEQGKPPLPGQAKGKWDQTPQEQGKPPLPGQAKGKWDQTPQEQGKPPLPGQAKGKWDQTPQEQGKPPLPGQAKGKWDQTPQEQGKPPLPGQAKGKWDQTQKDPPATPDQIKGQTNTQTSGQPVAPYGPPPSKPAPPTEPAPSQPPPPDKPSPDPKLVSDLARVKQEQAAFLEQYKQWKQQYDDWREQNQNHPNKEQFKQYLEQWQTYEQQMEVRRKMIDSQIENLQGQLAQTNKPADNPLPNQWSADNPLPNQWSSDKPTPNQWSSDKPTPNQWSSDKPTPNQWSSDKQTPNQWSADNPLPNQWSADKQTPNQWSADKPTPNQWSADNPLPNQWASDKPTPNQWASDKPTPNNRWSADKQTPNNQWASDKQTPNQWSGPSQSNSATNQSQPGWGQHEPGTAPSTGLGPSALGEPRYPQKFEHKDRSSAPRSEYTPTESKVRKFGGEEDEKGEEDMNLDNEEDSGGIIESGQQPDWPAQRWSSGQWNTWDQESGDHWNNPQPYSQAPRGFPRANFRGPGDMGPRYARGGPGSNQGPRFPGPGMNERFPGQGMNERFPGMGERFPGPGMNERFPGPGMNERFPVPGMNERFPGPGMNEGFPEPSMNQQFGGPGMHEGPRYPPMKDVQHFPPDGPRFPAGGPRFNGPRHSSGNDFDGDDNFFDRDNCEDVGYDPFDGPAGRGRGNFMRGPRGMGEFQRGRGVERGRGGFPRGRGGMLGELSQEVAEDPQRPDSDFLIGQEEAQGNGEEFPRGRGEFPCGRGGEFPRGRGGEFPRGRGEFPRGRGGEFSRGRGDFLRGRGRGVDFFRGRGAMFGEEDFLEPEQGPGRGGLHPRGRGRAPLPSLLDVSFEESMKEKFADFDPAADAPDEGQENFQPDFMDRGRGRGGARGRGRGFQEPAEDYSEGLDFAPQGRGMIRGAMERGRGAMERGRGAIDRGRGMMERGRGVIDGGRGMFRGRGGFPPEHFAREEFGFNGRGRGRGMAAPPAFDGGMLNPEEEFQEGFELEDFDRGGNMEHGDGDFDLRGRGVGRAVFGRGRGRGAGQPIYDAPWGNDEEESMAEFNRPGHPGGRGGRADAGGRGRGFRLPDEEMLEPGLGADDLLARGPGQELVEQPDLARGQGRLLNEDEPEAKKGRFDEYPEESLARRNLPPFPAFPRDPLDPFLDPYGDPYRRYADPYYRDPYLDPYGPYGYDRRKFDRFGPSRFEGERKPFVLAESIDYGHGGVEKKAFTPAEVIDYGHGQAGEGTAGPREASGAQDPSQGDPDWSVDKDLREIDQTCGSRDVDLRSFDRSSRSLGAYPGGREEGRAEDEDMRYRGRDGGRRFVPRDHDGRSQEREELGRIDKGEGGDPEQDLFRREEMYGRGVDLYRGGEPYGARRSEHHISRAEFGRGHEEDVYGERFAPAQRDSLLYEREDSLYRGQREEYGRGLSPLRSSPPLRLPQPTAATAEIVKVEDLLCPPARESRPPHVVVIIRGLPGSGKTYVSKLIREKEMSYGGPAPRMLCLDDYFMVETDKEVLDTDTGKKVKKKVMEYEYEQALEDAYRQSLLKSFKKTVDDGFFPFIILDATNERVCHFSEFWSYAKSKGFQVYVGELKVDIATCIQRNVHHWTEWDIEKVKKNWEPLPSHYIQLDLRWLLQEDSIPEVIMEDTEPESKEEKKKEEEEEDSALGGVYQKSKWELDTSEETLDKLDGIRVSKKHIQEHQSLNEYLQLDQMDDEYISRESLPGKKRVRWADLEEKKNQSRRRDLGFIVGQTQQDWERITDDDFASKALNRTKYFFKS
ncbi:YLP motif-containing protein 1-like [Physella acuta]|uniref:YLP motif-containing protein 1-like n=1 Tax=Physella acuta TaxID=109671 RepID=UPI0027DE7724|nr:YLP motif-containing protein 1-like [Physella acuta]